MPNSPWVNTSASLSASPTLTDVSGGGTVSPTARVREHVLGTTSSIGFYSTANLDLTFAESCDLIAVTASQDCWIRIYSTAAARAADASRVFSTDPTPGTGIMGEVFPYGPSNLSISWSPAPLFNNEDTVLSKKAYIAVTNMKSGYLGTFDLDFEILSQEYVDPVGPQGPTGLRGKSLMVDVRAPAGTDGQDGDSWIDKITNLFYGPKASGTWPSGQSIKGDTGATGTAGADGAPVDYISGLGITWVSGSALTVEVGRAILETGATISVNTAIAKTGISGLSASTLFHIYLYDNGGTPDFELSTAAPATPYRGTARSKTGNTARRYIGTIRTTAGSVLEQWEYLALDGTAAQLRATFPAFRFANGATTEQAETTADVSGYVFPSVIQLWINASIYYAASETTTFLELRGGTVTASTDFYWSAGFPQPFASYPAIPLNTPWIPRRGSSTSLFWYRRTWQGTTGRPIYIDLSGVRFTR